MSEYFLKPNILGRNVKVELNLSNFATKLYLKNTTGVDTPKYVKKVDLASLKSEIEKLETTSFDLSKLSDVVKNEVVKKTVYHELVKNVNAIRSSNAGNSVKKAD